MSLFIIPIFITHQGCPHRCIFCNQQSITGCQEPVEPGADRAMVCREIDRCLSWPAAAGRQGQVAFYGGSFTALPEERQQELLEAVQPYRQQGRVGALRLSTRPDAIGPGTGEFLRSHGVEIVELGVQSLEPRVLEICQRGHGVAQVEEAFAMLRAAGLRIGGQIMVGLPGETVGGVMEGAHRLAGLGPDFVRIYPTLVVKGSGLQKMYERGEYTPLSLHRAVGVCGRLLGVFEEHGIPVIRMGLQPTEELTANLVAGPHHPAFGELVRSRRFFRNMRRLLSGGDGVRRLLVAEADRSLFQGQKRCSVERLHRLGLLDGIEVVFEKGLPRGVVEVA